LRVQQAASDEPTAPSERQRQSLGELRKRANSVFIKACETGRLEEALAALTTERGIMHAHEERKPETPQAVEEPKPETLQAVEETTKLETPQAVEEKRLETPQAVEESTSEACASPPAASVWTSGLEPRRGAEEMAVATLAVADAVSITAASGGAGTGRARASAQLSSIVGGSAEDPAWMLSPRQAQPESLKQPMLGGTAERGSEAGAVKAAAGAAAESAASTALPVTPFAELSATREVQWEASERAPQITPPALMLASKQLPIPFVSPVSSRHAELLEKQRGLLDQQQSMQDHLIKLRSTSRGFVPVPPPAKPGSRRPVGSAGMLKELKDAQGKHMAVGLSPEGGDATFRDLHLMNANLSAENTRLNTELSRLLARAAQHTDTGSDHRAHMTLEAQQLTPGSRRL